MDDYYSIEDPLVVSSLALPEKPTKRFLNPIKGTDLKISRFQ